MNFHFPVMPRIFMALRREDRSPIVDILRRTPPIADNNQWATFLRNHDELTLEMVTLEERHYMWDEYAPNHRMRSNLGIRRRLASLVENSRDQIELLNALMLSLPGSPCIYYGDEIGMGDNIWLRDRNGVRTPMQWSADRNAGFSTAGSLWAPVISEAPFGFQYVNVHDQAKIPSSLLNWTRKILAVRKRHPSFRRGTMEFVLPDQPEILSYVRQTEGDSVLCVTNLSSKFQRTALDLSSFAGWRVVDAFEGSAFPSIDHQPYVLTLTPYGYFWLELIPE
jgi:maltose alpha-D-glucosyltransferase/alpha-amylase